MFAAIGPYVTGPLVALIVVGLIAAVLRWAFDSDTGRNGKLAPPNPDVPEPGDFGLLHSVAAVDDPRVAGELQARLAAAGIKATLAPVEPGGVDVLVFEDQLARARRIVGGITPI